MIKTPRNPYLIAEDGSILKIVNGSIKVARKVSEDQLNRLREAGFLVGTNTRYRCVPYYG